MIFSSGPGELFVHRNIGNIVAPDDWSLATAVSYTHLRAHETVLELVCRLLLEKKKTKNTKPKYDHID